MPSATDPNASAAGGARLPAIDALRGLAIVQMIAYHFCYDLDYFGWIHLRMLSDPAWIAWRSAIVSQFVFLAGVALALRAGAGEGRVAMHWRRWGQIAGCAALVSAASAFLFGARWIWFGVLHFVAVAQLLLPPLARRGFLNLLLGALLIAAGLRLRFEVFQPDWLSWMGFAPKKPLTEDFVPLVPWLGVMMLGIGAARVWPAGSGRAPAWLDRMLRPPALLGRWPLTVYILHQPMLFGLLELVRRV